MRWAVSSRRRPAVVSSISCKRRRVHWPFRPSGPLTEIVLDRVPAGAARRIGNRSEPRGAGKGAPGFGAAQRTLAGEHCSTHSHRIRKGRAFVAGIACQAGNSAPVQERRGREESRLCAFRNRNAGVSRSDSSGAGRITRSTPHRLATGASDSPIGQTNLTG